MAKLESGLMAKEEVEQCGANLDLTTMNTPPTSIKITQHLRDDLFALREIFDLKTPPEVQARRQTVHLILYGFADTSGGGLGSTVTVPGSGVRCRVRVWGKDDEKESSNYKKFENVVLTIEEEAKNGLLNGASMYLFTDNSTVEKVLCLKEIRLVVNFST
jgi:hypothetical protein